MAAKDGGEDRRPPRRPTVTLPPRSAVEGMFAAAAAGAGGAAGGGNSSEMSPGPLTLASSLFPEDSESEYGSFTQLLVGSDSRMAAASTAGGGVRPGPSGRPTSLLVPATTSGGVVSYPTGFSVAVSSSPGFYSPGLGNFEMSHQQALAQVTAQAANSPFSMLHQADFSPFTISTSGLSSHQQGSSINMASMQISHAGQSAFDSQGFQNMPLVVDKPADDGYNWRKYGQKTVKGGEYPRSYYKCTYQNCVVKKKVERSADGQITQIIYRGQHNHPRPPKRRTKDGDLTNDFDENPGVQDAPSKSEVGSQAYSPNDSAGGPSVSRRDREISDSSDSEEVDGYGRAGGDDADSNVVRRNLPAPAQRIIVQTTSEVDLLDDGYRWRKYGQKVVKGNPHPRSYYKCTQTGCDVKKHIERSSADPKAVITTYEGKHNHDVPVGRSGSHQAANVSGASSGNLLAGAHNARHRNQPLQLRDDLNISDQIPVTALQLKEEREAN